MLQSSSFFPPLFYTSHLPWRWHYTKFTTLTLVGTSSRRWNSLANDELVGSSHVGGGRREEAKYSLANTKISQEELKASQGGGGFFKIFFVARSSIILSPRCNLHTGHINLTPVPPQQQQQHQQQQQQQQQPRKFSKYNPASSKSSSRQQQQQQQQQQQRLNPPELQIEGTDG